MAPRIIQAADAITEFRGEHEFLSNFSPSPIWVPAYALEVPTAEHAFQMAKTTRTHAYQISQASTPREAKMMGRTGPITPDWEKAKRGVMLSILLWKFMQNDDLAEKLKATGHRPLIEGNTWGDTYWGAVPVPDSKIGELNHLPWYHLPDGEALAGHNWLGRTLMMVREVL